METIPNPATVDETRRIPDRAYTILQFFRAHHDSSLGLGNRSAAGVYAEQLLSNFTPKIDMSSGDYQTFGELTRNYRCLVLYAYLDAAYCFVNVCIATREKLGDFTSPEAIASLSVYQITLQLFQNAIDKLYVSFCDIVRKAEEYELYKRSWQRFYREQICAPWFPPAFDSNRMENFIRDLLALRTHIDEEMKFIKPKIV